MYSWVKLSQLVQWTGATVDKFEDIPVRRISTDTRSLQKGDLFLALRGEKFDGHDFIQKAVEAGALAVISERSIPVSVPLLLCNDSLKATISIGKNLRDAFSGKVIAITGSAGKSSTKDMIATLLGPGTVKSPASFNNLLGVSKTLFQIEDTTKHLVLEMGMNAKGEIGELASTFSPQMGMITNIGDAHIGKLGGVEGIFSAKKELFDYLAKQPSPTIALHVENPLVCRAADEAFRGKSPKIVRYSTKGDPRANVNLTRFGMDSQTGNLQVELKMGQQTCWADLPIYGLHQAENIAAATAGAICMGRSIEEIRENLPNLRPASHRGEIWKLPSGATLIDESYNSNPTALSASLRSLFEGLPTRPKVLILGEMRELGEFSEKLHRKIGSELRGWIEKSRSPIRVVTVGKEARWIAAELTGQVNSLDTCDEAISKIQIDPNEIALIKGSRGVSLDRLVARLRS